MGRPLIRGMTALSTLSGWAGLRNVDAGMLMPQARPGRGCLGGACEPRIVAGQDDDGCVVFALSSRLSAALAGAERSKLADVAASWVARRAEDGEVIDVEVADVILGELAALVSGARRQGQSVYCWVA